jgi:hypothetical protein
MTPFDFAAELYPVEPWRLWSRRESERRRTSRQQETPHEDQRRPGEVGW